MRNTGPRPTSHIATPATAGPMMRAVLNVAADSDSALGSSTGSTSSETNAWRTGVSIALTVPISRGEDEDQRERHQVGRHEQAHRETEPEVDGVRGDEQTALVVPVGELAPVERQQQDRRELQAGHEAERGGRVVGELEHQPVLGDELHPDADAA